MTLRQTFTVVLAGLFPAVAAGQTTYYVRTDGGSPTLCTGLANQPYPGSGQSQPCAWDHPFRALPPEGPARITGGDTLVIGAGSYMIGWGAPDSAGSNCDVDYPWGCHMQQVPSGLDQTNRTRILGQGWDNGCHNPPELWGTERVDMIINLDGSDHVEVTCLEITDHSGCVEDHTGGLACNRSCSASTPCGPWAVTGLFAVDSTDAVLRHLDIHGLAHTGVFAGRLTDWTVEDVRIAGNGWVGWDGDVGGVGDGSNSSNSGTLLFRRWTVEWNGCGETYLEGSPTGCWAQTAGGYGDGVGTGYTQGHWVIEDSAFLHNTSDGLDLLYMQSGSSVEIRRTIAEGNAGNQIKTNGPGSISNSIVVGNCGFFDGAAFTFDVDNCRAMGNAVSLGLRQGEQISVTNSTFTSEGDCLVLGECDVTTGACDGSEQMLFRNNIFAGHPDFSSDDLTCLVYTENLPTTPDIDYSVINGVKDDACPGGSDICGSDPGLASSAIDSFDAHLAAGSPAIDSANATDAPEDDFNGFLRDQQPDRGAHEYDVIFSDRFETGNTWAWSNTLWGSRTHFA